MIPTNCVLYLSLNLRVKRYLICEARIKIQNARASSYPLEIGSIYLFVVEYAKFFFAFRVVEDLVSLEFVLLGLLDCAVVFFCA